MTDPQAQLKNLEPRHDYLIAIDSDGCAFDTMELKQKECFIPNVIKYWDLQAVSRFAREAAEFVNLYSRWRGINRFPALTKTFDLLEQRPEVLRRGARIPQARSLRRWIEHETTLSNPALGRAAERTGDPQLRQALAWSEAINASVAEMVRGVAPFPYVAESLAKIAQWADLIVCSVTSCAALQKEWSEHGIADFVRVIAGQEMGSKQEILQIAIAGRYDSDKVLMLGDAPGDRTAAVANQAAFYPIMAGAEEASWRRFHEEVSERFHAGTYTAELRVALEEEFDRALPERPPWQAL